MACLSAPSPAFCLLAYQTKVGSIISVGLGALLRVMHGEACRSCRSCNFVCEGMYKALDAGRLYGIINGISPAVFLYVLKLGGKRLIIAFAGEGHGLVQYFLGVVGYGEFRGISRIALAVAGERQMNAVGYLLSAVPASVAFASLSVWPEISTPFTVTPSWKVVEFIIC